MILVRLSGGLGNQMFQYAAARRLALVHGASLHLDTGRLRHTDPGDTPRGYALGCFTLSASLATPAEERLCARLERRAAAPLGRLLGRCGLAVRRSGVQYVRQRTSAFNGSLLSLPDNCCLDGLWQSEQYFCDIRDTLLREFTPRVELADPDRRLAADIASCCAVSLHVRRGDYLTNPRAANHHGTCSQEYYRQAVAAMAAHEPDVRLFIFTDDPEWVARNLRFDVPSTCVSVPDCDDACRDLQLMRLCRHHIIANSSFSWWGAWLADGPAKTVIAPARWYADPTRDASAIIPDTWLRV